MACFFCNGGTNKKYDAVHKTVSVSEAVAKSAIAWVRGRPVFSDTELQVRRLRICQTCDFRQLKGSNLKCGICGCDIPLKTKIVETQCPQGKW
jgi:hypothetical protein